MASVENLEAHYGWTLSVGLGRPKEPGPFGMAGRFKSQACQALQRVCGGQMCAGGMGSRE